MDRFIEFVTNHWMLFSGVVIVLVLLLQDLIESLTQKFTSISPIMAVAKMNQEGVMVIDVREESEYKKGHIENALNLPFGKFDEHIKTLAPYKQTPLIITCQSGTRSAQACKKLCKEGFTQVLNLQGGMLAWEDSKLPIRSGSK